MKRFTISCLLAVVLWGCNQVTSPPSSGESDISFSTESQSYSLSEHETIDISIENNTDVQYYIKEPSFNLTLEKKTDGEWKNFGSWYAKAAVVPEPSPLGAKDTFSKEVHIDGIQDVISLEEGIYRFQYMLYSDEDATEDHRKVIHTNAFFLN